MVHIHTIETINESKPKDSRLMAIRFNGYKENPCGAKTKLVLCLCECGKYVTVYSAYIISGNSKSCGCFRGELTKGRCQKYFPKIDAIYSSWTSMIRRCYNREDDSYPTYGGKGVVVCEEWRNDYQKFLDWSLANGWDKGLRLDKDILGNGLLYSPNTCKWATQLENANNTSRSKKYNYNGGNYSVAEISRMVGLPQKFLHKRISGHGWTIEDAVNIPKRGQRKNYINEAKPHGN